MTKEHLAEIETVVRQQWCDDNSPWESWLNVDQDQALAVIGMIADRMPARPKLLPIPGIGPPLVLDGEA
jgi:hypothetical protein